MTTVIIYKTKYGSTKEYAEILSKELKCKAIEMDSVKKLSPYSRVIVMSGTYAGRMPLTGFLKSSWSSLKDKEVIAIAIGLVSKDHLWSKITYWFIPFWIRNKINYFKIMGRDPESKKPVSKANLKQVIDYLNKK